jgi:hypothetical protein
MAAFSKRHYLLLAQALARTEHICDSCGGPKVYSLHIPATDCRGCANPAEHHPFKARDNEATLHVADNLEQDNPAFNREHFLAVVRGEREINSKPPRGNHG